MTITFGEQLEMTERVAGRELDAEVAEKVMWADLDLTDYHIERAVPDCYSTSIAAAWQVVEKMKLDSPMVRYDAYRDDDRPRWTCAINGVRGDANTAPLAICLAALKAVENAPNPR